MMIGWGWASWGETFTRFLPHTPSSNAPSPPSAGRRHRDCRRTVRRTPIRSLPPACLIGSYPTSRPLLSPDVFPQRVLLVFRRLVLRSEEHTSELQSLRHLVCRLLLEKNKTY